MTKRIRIGVLASGGGTDLQSIIDASIEKKIDADVVVVCSDKKEAHALERAKNHDILAYFIDPTDKTLEEFDDDIDTIATEHHCDLLVGAGYMRILSKEFVQKWYGKLINIHPSILPSFKGVNGQGDALAYGVKIAGCTTHFMDNKMDHGPIILQAAVQVLKDDTRDTLADRILQVEHQILPRTIQLFAENRLQIKGRCVHIKTGKSWKEIYKTKPNVLYPEGY
jgi:phosphoribosylglycinamide formyltransferase-1